MEQGKKAHSNITRSAILALIKTLDNATRCHCPPLRYALFSTPFKLFSSVSFTIFGSIRDSTTGSSCRLGLVVRFVNVCRVVCFGVRIFGNERFEDDGVSRNQYASFIIDITSAIPSLPHLRTHLPNSAKRDKKPPWIIGFL